MFDFASTFVYTETANLLGIDNKVVRKVSVNLTSSGNVLVRNCDTRGTYRIPSEGLTLELPGIRGPWSDQYRQMVAMLRQLGWKLSGDVEDVL